MTKTTTLPLGIYIHMEGGLVQDVYYVGPRATPIDKLSVFVVDFDTEGADLEAVTHASRADGSKIEAYVLDERLLRLPKACDIAMLVQAKLAEEES